MLRVWGDINSEEPTHVIDLHGALDSLYKDSRDTTAHSVKGDDASGS